MDTLYSWTRLASALYCSLDYKDIRMIRFVIGFLMLFGIAGGLDTATDTELVYLLLLVIPASLLMLSGTNSLGKRYE